MKIKTFPNGVFWCLILLCGGLVAPVCLCAQNKDYDELNQLIQKSKYAACLKKAEKMIAKSPEQALPHFYKAIAIYGELRTVEKPIGEKEADFQICIDELMEARKTWPFDTAMLVPSSMMENIQNAAISYIKRKYQTNKLTEANSMVTSYLQVFDNKWPQFSNNTFTSLDKMFADYVEANPKKSAEVYALQAKCLSIYLKNIPLNRSERLMRNEQVHFFKQFKKMETAGMDSVPDQLLFQIFQKFDNSTAEQTNYIAFDVYNYFTQQIANSSKKKSEKYSTRFNHFVRNYPGLFNNKKPCRFDKEYCFTEWDKPEYLWAATTINASYLTDDEKDIIYLMNLARLNPKLFNNTFVKTYLKEGPKTSYERSLVSFLDNCKPVQLLYPSGQLSQAAAYHAKDMGEKDMTGHTSSDRTSFPKRLKRYWVDPYVGENCSYGPNDPLDIVMQLMIDEGVPNLGHRVNIFTADYFFTGVSVAPHKTYRWNSVMDFAGGTE